MGIGNFIELRLDLDDEWEAPPDPVTVERPYTDLELALIEQMRIERDERRTNGKGKS